MSNIFIVSSHYNEDLKWLINQKEYEYLIYSKNSEAREMLMIDDSRLKIIKNRGMEVSSFLSFMIDYYDNLPDYIAFCHGHLTAWHQDDTILNVLKRYNFTDEYLTLNNPYYRNSIYDDCPQEIQFNKEDRVWEKIKRLQSDLMIKLPNKIEITMGAQFIVKKESILRNGLSFYKNLLNWVYTQNEMSEQSAGILIEQLWYLILTGKEVEPRLLDKTILSTRGYIE